MVAHPMPLTFLATSSRPLSGLCSSGGLVTSAARFDMKPMEEIITERSGDAASTLR